MSYPRIIRAVIDDDVDRLDVEVMRVMKLASTNDPKA